MTRRPQPPPLIVGPAALDRAGRRVMIAGHLIHLPDREAAVLDLLMHHPGRVLSCTQLKAAAGQHSDNPARVAKVVDRLGRRLTIHPLLPPLIERVGTTGYRFTRINNSTPT
jgi:DNA-binding response OmpR family regulator